MTLLPYYIFFLQVVRVISLEEVTGYLGENVTLLSGADQSWTLSKIEWSIFSNNTWIATYRQGTTNTDRVAQYEDRLSLNSSTGDLVIVRLTAHDAMEYTVDLNGASNNTVKKINLVVIQRLKKPTINTVFSQDMGGGCWMMLNCTSPDEDVQLTWDFKPSSLSGTIGISGAHTYLVAFIDNKQDFEFTCNATTHKNSEPVSQTVKPKCVAPEVKPTPTLVHVQQRDRSGVCFLVGLFLGVLLLAAVFFGGKILHCLKEYPSSSKESNADGVKI